MRCRLLIAILSLSVFGGAQSQAGEPRRYSTLPTDEARQIAERAISSKQIAGLYSSIVDTWILPTHGPLYVQGVRINQSDSVVFAAAKSSQLMRMYKRGLPPNVPATTMDPIPFHLNGVLVSTVDLELANQPGQLIKRGGYEWWVSPLGVWLGGRAFIPFPAPLSDFSESLQQSYVVEFSVPSGEAALFQIRLGGQTLQVK